MLCFQQSEYASRYLASDTSFDVRAVTPGKDRPRGICLSRLQFEARQRSGLPLTLVVKPCNMLPLGTCSTEYLPIIWWFTSLGSLVLPCQFLRDMAWRNLHQSQLNRLFGSSRP